MITYESGGLHCLFRIVKLKGSVVPKALLVALPCALASALLKTAIQHGLLPSLESADSIVLNSAAWSGFSFFVGFLVVFRTSESYKRFWEGCTSTHQMRAEWFDACSALVAFCKISPASPARVREFQNKVVRLFSMLHALALADVEDSGEDIDKIEAFNYELVDVGGIDEESLATLRDSACKVELIYQWIQQIIVEEIHSGLLNIPPPILSRSFQELANGMVAFHEAIKISFIPFPFPYAQTCDILLSLHLMVIPFVVSQWTTTPFFAALFSFIQVLTLWSLNFIAVEIENPFGTDDNDIDCRSMQLELNQQLQMIIKPSTLRSPQLSHDAVDLAWGNCPRASFMATWQGIDPHAEVSRSGRKTGFFGSEGGDSPKRVSSAHSEPCRLLADLLSERCDAVKTSPSAPAVGCAPGNTVEGEVCVKVEPLPVQSLQANWQPLPANGMLLASPKHGALVPKGGGSGIAPKGGAHDLESGVSRRDAACEARNNGLTIPAHLMDEAFPEEPPGCGSTALAVRGRTQPGDRTPDGRL